MRRALGLLPLILLPVSLAGPAGAGAPQARDCSAYGYSLRSVEDNRGSLDPYRLAIVYRRHPDGSVGPVAARSGLVLCPGDVLETWHDAKSTVVRGNNAGSVVAQGGSVLRFSDRLVQEAGTVTYLMPSGWPDPLEAAWESGALLVSSVFSTVQVSMTGPACSPTVEVAVSALDDPFIGGSTAPNPSAHGARLTVLDAEGRPVGAPLELKGAEWARLSPGDRQAKRGDPARGEALTRLAEVEPALRAPLTGRAPPTDAERAQLAPVERALRVQADARPVEVRVNGLAWAPRRWFRAGRGPDGARVWEAARGMSLPPGPSLVEVTLADGRQAVVQAEGAAGALVVAFVRPDERAPATPTPPKEVTSTTTLADKDCALTPSGGPTGAVHTVTVQGVSMDLIGLCGGTFRMGSLEGVGNPDERPQHAVQLSAFFVGATEVTQTQWRAVVLAAQAADDPDAKGLSPTPSTFKGDALPVETVSWCDATRFANALSRLDGRSPVYTIVDGCAVSRIDGADGYRLPTEAEWEYAARAGTTTAYWSGDTEADLARVGWYGAYPEPLGGNAESRTHPVAEKPANAWGLHDVHGNVWEWCEDHYDEGAYALRAAGLSVDPGGLPTSAESADRGASRVVRGGSWNYWPVNARSAVRDWNLPSDSFRDLGFRLLLSSPERG
jgi:formylglycine-generating enzyme required for sulfatase activity